MSSIAGKVIVITGASSGLGEATARRLAGKGAKVFLGARRADRLKAISTDIERAGGQAGVTKVDVTKRADVETFIRAALEKFGRIDVLINNAGLMAQAPLAKTLVDVKVSPGGAVYAATKHAVRAISEGVRLEVDGIRTTIISPGAVQSELPLGSSDPETVARLNDFYSRQAISPDSVARAIAYAIEQPADVDINEIVLRPTAQDL